MRILKSQKNIFSKDNNLRFIATVMALLVLFALSLSIFFTFEHECVGEHCLICMCSSNANAVKTNFCSFVLVVLVFFVISVPRQRENICETLVTLKRKLTD